MERITFDQLPEAVAMLADEVSELKRLLIEKHDQSPIPEPEHLLDIKQTAEFLRLTVPTVYSKVSRGELPVMKRGKRLYFSRGELLAYVKEGRKKTQTEIQAEAESYCREGVSTRSN